MGLLLYIVSIAALVLAVCRSATPVDARQTARVGIRLWGGCVSLLPTAFQLQGPDFAFLPPALLCVAGLGAALTVVTLERNTDSPWRAVIILLVVGLIAFAIGLLAGFPLFLLVPA